VAQIALELGIPDNVLYRWVTGQRQPKTVEAVAVLETPKTLPSKKYAPTPPRETAFHVIRLVRSLARVGVLYCAVCHSDQPIYS